MGVKFVYLNVDARIHLSEIFKVLVLPLSAFAENINTFGFPAGFFSFEKSIGQYHTCANLSHANLLKTVSNHNARLSIPFLYLLFYVL